MSWSYRKTAIFGQAPGEDDWQVLLDGRAVGQVYVSHLPEPENLWLWAAWSNPPDQGYAPSLEDALEVVRDPIRKLGVSPGLPSSHRR